MSAQFGGDAFLSGNFGSVLGRFKPVAGGSLEFWGGQAPGASLGGRGGPWGPMGGPRGPFCRSKSGQNLPPNGSQECKFAHTGCLGAPGPFAWGPSAAALPHTSDPSPCSPRGPSQRPGGSLQSAGPLHTKAPLFSSWGKVVLLCSPRPFLNGWTWFFF